GLQILLKAALLLPIPAFMFWFNYTVDRAGVFHGDRYNREMAQLLIEGNVLNGYDQINEQGLLELLAQNIEEPYDTLVLGSSRALMMRGGAVGGGTVMNCGVSNADMYDLLGIWYMFDKAGMAPENLIIVPDPWLLCAEHRDPRSKPDLYNEFLSERLGMDNGFIPEDETAQQLQALTEPSYFQGNLDYWFNERTTEEKPPVVTGDVENQPVNIKLADGSVLYDKAFRQGVSDATVLQRRMLGDTNTFYIKFGYDEPDPQLTAVYEDFIEYLHGLGVKVSILLPPYSPLVYTYAAENKAYLGGVFESENTYRRIAAEYGIPVYGSYNPYLSDIWDFGTTEFFDGLHPQPEVYGKIYPGVEQAARDQSAPYQWEPYGGKTIGWETAEAMVKSRYEIAPPHTTERAADEQVHDKKAYIVERWGQDPNNPNTESDPVVLARYAVVMEDGTVYRYDTEGQMWVEDLRFPPN
ncbi:SGNH/GDSL hydrolase family protein, partial [Ruminococcaceae bacterium OttesenSCG-928-D13]|nr:SGNH/GDSL hydrolase family protein [Ruminococcaceae bacterium OttesenSCG-928-D13]